jgi:hypothetical protein
MHIESQRQSFGNDEHDPAWRGFGLFLLNAVGFLARLR